MEHMRTPKTIVRVFLDSFIVLADIALVYLNAVNGSYIFATIWGIQVPAWAWLAYKEWKEG